MWPHVDMSVTRPHAAWLHFLPLVQAAYFSVLKIFFAADFAVYLDVDYTYSMGLIRVLFADVDSLWKLHGISDMSLIQHGIFRLADG